MAIEFQQLQSLLRRRVDAAEVVDLIGPDSSIIERDEYYGSVEFRDQGFDLVLKEAAWVLPSTAMTDPKELIVVGFHFHREGHEGYRAYTGRLPSGVALNDSQQEIRRKLGQPFDTGGGGVSSVLKRPLPRWIKYIIGQVVIHFQFDSDDKVEMITLFAAAPPTD